MTPAWAGANHEAMTAEGPGSAAARRLHAWCGSPGTVTARRPALGHLCAGPFRFVRAGQPAVISPHRAARKVAMRFGNTEVRFLGGPMGCLVMLMLSVLVSVVLTVLVNVVF
jgi:hypothetical protein